MARRRVPLAEFDVATNPDVQRTLTVLTAARLLTADRGTVEVAHEALFREWPRLEAWLDEDAAEPAGARAPHGGRPRVGRERPDARRAVPWRAPGRRARLERRSRAPRSTSSSASSSPRARRPPRPRSDGSGGRTAGCGCCSSGASVGLMLAIAASVVALGQRAAAEQSNTVAEEQRAVADQQRAVATRSEPPPSSNGPRPTHRRSSRSTPRTPRTPSGWGRRAWRPRTSTSRSCSPARGMAIEDSRRPRGEPAGRARPQPGGASRISRPLTAGHRPSWAARTARPCSSGTTRAGRR